MTIVLAALALAAPVALFVLWPLLRRREASASLPAEDAWAALEADKGLALRALRELERDHEAGLMAAEDYAELRARYEARASAILRRLDELGPRPPAAPPAGRREAAAPGPAVPVPWTRQPLTLTGAGLGILVFGVLLGILVMRYTAPAPPEPTAGMPGPTESPGPGGPEGAAEAGTSRPIPQAMLEGMLRAAHTSLDEGRYQEAIAAYKAVLKRQPDNVDAITHIGVILAIAGHAEPALEAFDRALAIDPSYAHALWDKARVLYELRQDYAGAIGAWERFVAVTPAGADREQALARIREAKTRLGGGQGAPAGSGPTPGTGGSKP